MVIPTFVLIYLKKGILGEVFLFSFSLGIPFGLYIQLIAERNNIWNYEPFFVLLAFKNMPLEAIFWYPAWFGIVTATYIYFVDKHKHFFWGMNRLYQHFKYFTFCVALLFFSIGLMFLDEQYLIFPHPYITVLLPMGLLSLLLFIYNRHKNFLRVFVPTTLILFLPMLLYDLIGVNTNQWVFGGNYLFTIPFGIANLPVEEFIIWLLILPASVIAYFEEFEFDFK
jgi:hypothetical protein